MTQLQPNHNVMPLSACLAHYAERFSGRKSAKQRMRIAEFTENSHTGSVVYWLNGSYLPKGLSFWRVTVFFHLIGYRVEEFERLREEYQKAVVLLGAGVMEAAELAREFGYHGDQRISQMYTVLRNNTLLSDDKMLVIKQFVEEQTSIITEIYESTALQYSDVILEKTLPVKSPEPELEPTPVVHEVAPPEKVTVVETTADASDELAEMAARTLAGLIQTAVPLAKLLDSDRVTENVRDRLRQLSGPGASGVFELSNLLNRLCGPRARQSLRNGDKK